MANARHVEIVRKGRAALAQWRRAHPGQLLDLSDADLQELDLKRSDLRKAILVGAKLAMADLSGADLTGADLTRADLTGVRGQRVILAEAQLSRASLRGADLRGASLRAARCDYCDFSNADLTYANLIEADLKSAYLKGSRLVRAILWRTNLRGASLEEAVMGWTALMSLDLLHVSALSSVRHLAPSTLGIDTFYLSKGELPRSFLQGCGVPETLVTLKDRFVPHAWKGVQCFVVCESKQQQFGERLRDALHQNNLRCWLDVRSDEHADAEVPRPAWREFDVVILCLCKAALTSQWLPPLVDELIRAEDVLRKRLQLPNLRLLYPVTLDGFLLTGAWDHPAERRIVRQLTADFTGWRRNKTKFDEELAKILDALKERPV